VDEAGAQQVQQALGWFETNRYPYEASLCLLTLGRFQRDRGDLVAAETSYRKQLELARETQDDFQTVAALSGVASILMRREKFPEALKVTQEQLEICRRMGNALQAAYAEASLADIYVELGRFDESAAASQNVEKAAKQGQMDELLAWMSATRTRALLLAGRYRDAAQSADDGLRTWEAMIRRRGRELLELQALAQTSAAPAARLALCERSRKIAQGSVAVELALNLTEAGFYLEAKDGRRALELAKALRGPLEKQGSDYSVFRAALIEATAMKQLGQNENDAASRASEALGRFQKQFEADGWERFRKRADFVYWENNLRQVKK
jgi:tetratricopeptide (TPR) repeat protein